MNTTKVIIETENLLLKSISLDYKEDIFREFTSEITLYMRPSPPKKIEETIQFIEESLEKNKKGIDFCAAVLCKKTGEYLGNTGVHRINTKTPELGIWIKKSAHGNGYGKEAVKGMKDWAENNLKYDYLLYPVVYENYASRKIAEFLGGKMHREYEETNFNGEKHHMVEYRIYPL